MSPGSKQKKYSTSEKKAVLEELERILAHPAFKSSARCINFLRYVVEHHLRGDQETLKERTLGVEVFGREATYDSSQDPVVRATASEVRKRLAQYYQVPDHQQRIKIQLNSGSYIPEFQFLAEMPETSAVPSPADPVVSAQPKRARGYVSSILFGAAVMVIIALLVWQHRRSGMFAAESKTVDSAQASADMFWRPTYTPPDHILVCVGMPSPQLPKENPDTSFVSLRVASVFSRLALFFDKRGRSLDLKPSADVTFSDMQQTPTIVVGGWTNSWTWTDHTETDARYYFAAKRDSNVLWIADRQNPSSKEWSFDTSQPPSKLTQDYAIIGRMPDTETKHPRVYIGGLGENGTIAAVDCLVDARCIDNLVAHAPKDWATRNVEWLLKVPIISGSPGSPEILDVFEMRSS